jgi:DNA-binding protein Fis
LSILERRLVTRVLQHTGGNQSRAAKMLGVTVPLSLLGRADEVIE